MLPAERRLGQILGAVGVGTALSWVGLNLASGGMGPPTIASLARAETKAPADALTDPDFPSEWPYSTDDLRRRDESSDTRFYVQPRLVTHIDDSAIAALTSFYSQQPVFAKPADVALLDVASSWISHYPSNFDGSAGRVALLGMNQYELEQNRQGTEQVVKDLNDEPLLPYGDEEFDAVTIAVSVDYLAQPLEVFREINRVLKPGGVAYMSFSNRCFPTKVVGMWLSTNDPGHIWIVGSYFHFAGGFTAPVVHDISAGPGFDPMYVISAEKTNG